MQFEELVRRLLSEISEDEDCLRLYRLADVKGCEVREYGRFRAIDFEKPIVL
jgi:CRISPR-associated protein Cas2